MDTRARLRAQRRTMFRDFFRSIWVWIFLLMFLVLFITRATGNQFSPALFWGIVAFGLIGVAVQVIRLFYGRRKSDAGTTDL